jgi:hypothetical protein
MPEEKVQKRAAAAGGGDDAAAVIAEYRSARAYRGWMLRLVSLVILAIVATGFYRYYRYGRGVFAEFRNPDTQQAALSTLRTQLDTKVRLEGRQMYDRLAPKVIQLAKEKANAARPELEQVLKTEAETLQKNLQSMLEAKLKALVERIIEENKESLQQDFPGITDPAKMEALVEMLVNATESAAFNVFDPRFKEHYAVLESIDAKRNQLPVEDANKPTTELLYRVGEVGWDLLLMKTGRSAETPAAAAAAQPAAKPTAAPAAPAPAAPAPAPAPAVPAPAAAPAPVPAAPGPAPAR